MGLDVRTATIEEILKSPKPLTMARYQRHYEWTPKEMEQLVGDLMDRFADPRRGVDGEYFVGSFILFSPVKQPAQIVDGQQRLTSLSLILAVARDMIADPAQKASIDSYLTKPADPLGGTRATQRLVLHRGDDAFYAANIVPPDATIALGRLDPVEGNDSHEALRKNTNRARTLLNDLKPEDRAAFVHFVVSNCVGIRIAVSDEADAFRIFETVNTRGRSLRNEDVFRVALVDYATGDEKKRDELLRKWGVIENKVGQDKMPVFISQWRKQHLKGRKPNKSLDKDIIESFASPEAARSFLDSTFSIKAGTFNEIMTARVHGLGNTAIKRAIDKRLSSMLLVLDEFDDWVPVAMLLLERYRSEREALLWHLKLLDRMVWFFYLKRDHVKVADDCRTRFGAILAEYSDPAATVAFRAELSAKEKAEMRGFIEGRIHPKWVPLKRLLVRLEMAVDPSRRHDSLDSFTIEHVLPHDAVAPYWRERFEQPSVLSDYLQRAGNLCLVEGYVNMAMSNKSFPGKKTIAIEQEAHKMTKMAACFEAETEWTKDVIDRRTAWLAGVFCEAFDIHAG